METVFQAETSVEAHMIVHLLERSDIAAEVLGEHLQGGVGELPATGNVRVVVAKKDALEAKRIISEWEAKNQADSQIQPTTSRKNPWSPVLIFLAGAGIASAYWLWATNSSVGPRSADYNRDGEPDEWVYWRGDTLSKVEQDRDHDGGVDAVFNYSARDFLETAEFDDDFDGNFEYTVTYRFAQPKTDEIDADQDGHSDRRSYYVNGVLRRTQHFRPGTPIVRKTQLFDHGQRLVEAQWDSDNDGIVDTLIKYDRYEEEVSRDAIPGDN